MQVSPIQVGPISLQDFEIPQSVRYGGRHRLIVHTLAGGQRSIERLGPDDSEIRFLGTFSGPDAENRARAFNNLRLSGEVVWLTWETFRRQVIVKTFIGEYHSPCWISYRVSCVVVRQEQNASFLQTTMAAILSSDLGNALLLSGTAGIGLTSLQSVLSAPNVFTAGSQNQARATAIVSSTMETANNLIDQQSATLSATFGTRDPSKSWGLQFAATVGCAGSHAAAVNVRSYVGRIGVNIAAAVQ